MAKVVSIDYFLSKKKRHSEAFQRHRRLRQARKTNAAQAKREHLHPTNRPVVSLPQLPWPFLTPAQFERRERFWARLSVRQSSDE